MKTFDQLAASAYETYIKKVDGLLYGPHFETIKPQPTYAELTDGRKAVWVAVVQQVAAEIAVMH